MEARDAYRLHTGPGRSTAHRWHCFEAGWNAGKQDIGEAIREALGIEPAELEAQVRALVMWANLVVQYMEKGEPYWYGDGLKEQGRAALAPFQVKP